MIIQPKFQQIHAFEVLRENGPDTLIFAGTDTGLFVSRDAGRSWENALENSEFLGSAVAPAASVTALKAHRAEDGSVTLFAGTLGGIFRSTNLGESWEAIVFGRPAPVITAFTVSRNHYIHATTLADGVFTSADDGKHWERWNFGLIDWRVYSIASAAAEREPALLFAGTESGIYASKNNGRTWRDISFPDASGAVLALGATPDGQTLFAGTEHGVIYYSQDLGERWQSVYQDADASEIIAILSSRDDHGETITFAACGSQLLSAQGNGAAWQVCQTDAITSTATITALSVSVGPHSLWAACDDGSVIRLAGFLA